MTPMTNEAKELLALIILTIATLIFVIALPNHDIPQTESYFQSHTVREGETLSEIVEQYGGSLKSTLAEHPNTVIMPGEKVLVFIEN